MVAESPQALRRRIREGRFQGLTTGHAAGYVQANLAIVPESAVAHFVGFCRANATACPVLAIGRPGDPGLAQLGGGCWFSMEEALLRAGVRLRHIELGIQGPLFRSDRDTNAIGCFRGPLVVSMRPFARDEVETVKAVTGNFPRVHGAPIHEGDPTPLGIKDLMRPDFGEPIPLGEDGVPLYWGCGLTALAALEQSGIPLFITHAPGAMLVTGLHNDDLAG